MDIEWLRKYCLSFPGSTEEIKWGHDLCFMVGGKMFCVTGLEEIKVGFKVPDEQFEEISTREGFIPAPYMARAKWVLVQDPTKLQRKEWEKFISQSYTLVKEKLTKKAKKELGIK